MDFGNFREMSRKICKDRKLKKFRMPSSKSFFAMFVKIVYCLEPGETLSRRVARCLTRL